MESSTSQNSNLDNDQPAAEKDLNIYLPLYRAICDGDWEKARIFFDAYPDAIDAPITEDRDTPLHLAVKRGRRISFLEKLVDVIPPKALELQDASGSTALHVAATLGNTRAAKLLVTKHQLLLYIRNKDNYLPVHLAALHGKRETTFYLLVFTKDDEEANLFGDESGALLMRFAINARFYDVARYLLQRYPQQYMRLSIEIVKNHTQEEEPGPLEDIAQEEEPGPLEDIAQDPSAFPSRTRFNIWQRFIYYCVPLKLENFSNYSDEEDMENIPVQGKNTYQIQSLKGNCIVSGCEKLRAVIWKVLDSLVPYIKHIHDTKLLHHQAVQLVKHMCNEAVRLDNTNSSLILKGSFLSAAKYGIDEIVQEILSVFPNAITFKDKGGHTALHLAIMYRHENVFNIINQQSGDYKEFLLEPFGDKKNNILHLAGKLAYQDRLDFVSTALLQVQRELQWYKEVEKFVLPRQREAKNKDEKTPLMVFIEEHSKMITHEEQWMKSMANSCTVVATLIGAVAFAAAITVPGGNNSGGDNAVGNNNALAPTPSPVSNNSTDEGLPIFRNEVAFIVFNVSNALALFSSLSTVIMFLAILISRYATIDFLYTLPNRLIIGLLALFLSVTSMIISFSATLYLVSGQKELILVPLAVLTCLPVTLFVFLQFPLLLNMIKATYVPTIFSSHKSNKKG
uniref:PGG domain-containing protein n=1 Tax=Davidia involucrata TaxID=16924 RepID=A0A5B7A565_DAVIN